MIQLLFSMYKVSFMAGFSLDNNSRNNTKKIRLVGVNGCSITEKKNPLFYACLGFVHHQSQVVILELSIKTTAMTAFF